MAKKERRVESVDKVRYMSAQERIAQVRNIARMQQMQRAQRLENDLKDGGSFEDALESVGGFGSVKGASAVSSARGVVAINPTRHLGALSQSAPAPTVEPVDTIVTINRVSLEMMPYESRFLRQIYNLFYETVHRSCVKDYSANELDAWAPSELDEEAFSDWDSILANHYSLLIFVPSLESLGVTAGYGAGANGASYSAGTYGSYANRASFNGDSSNGHSYGYDVNEASYEESFRGHGSSSFSAYSAGAKGDGYNGSHYGSSFNSGYGNQASYGSHASSQSSSFNTSSAYNKRRFASAYSPQALKARGVIGEGVGSASASAGSSKVLVGFADLDMATGYLDRLYVHHLVQGRGLGGMLCEEMEREAKRLGFASISTRASKTALPFFKKRGFRVLSEEHVARRGEVLECFMMAKDLE